MNCSKCGHAIQPGSRFCGNCGALVEPQQSQFTEPTSPKKRKIQATLTLIKGEGFDGVEYQLNADEHIMGRLYGTILFPEDPYLSMEHANLYYKGDQLFIEDKNSVNGVFIKIHHPVELKDGDLFLTGEQLFRFEIIDNYKKIPNLNLQQHQTKFYGCPPEEQLYFRIVHLFRNGQEGAVYYASSPSVNIGREQCELSFPFDRHISGRHARVYKENNSFYLQDLSSKNGTFHAISAPYNLLNGDHFFVGQQLMRVEITPL